MNKVAVLTVVAWLWLVGLAILGLLAFGVKRHHFETAGIAFGVFLFTFAWFRQRRARVLQQAAPAARSRLVYFIPTVAALLAFGWSLTLGPLSDDFVLRRWALSGEWTPQSWPHLRPLPLAF